MSILLEVREIKGKRRIAIVLSFIILVKLLLIYPVFAEDDKVSLNFKGVDLRDAFRALADIANMNVITDNTVQGTVTVNLKEISFMESIKLLTMSNGLDYRIVGNTILVGSPEVLQASFDKKVTKVFELKNANPEEVKKTINLLVEDGSIRVDNRTNSILITTYEDNLPKIENIVKNLDKPNKQVIIEARIEDISRDKLKNIGINWNFAAENTSNGASVIWDNADSSDSKESNVFEIGDVGVSYTSLLAALHQNGDSTTLANPKISTMDGKEAVINIGQEVPIITKEEDDDKITTKVEFRDVGTVLRLTPRINDNNNISLDIRPEVSEVSDYVDNMPVINTKKVETNVRVKNGQTIAIGGLISNNQIEKLSKVPILGDVPILGKLFRNRKMTNEKRELVIFITPKIIDEKEGEAIEKNSTESHNTENKNLINAKEPNELFSKNLKPYEYQIKDGDTFESIGKLFNISFAKIMVYNNIDSPEKLEVGQVLLIPVPKNRYYRLKATDSINNIAKKYNISIDDLKRINGLDALQTKEGVQLVLPVEVEE